MKTTSAEVDSFIKRFLAAQDKMRILLERVPHGCQNWSYQKSVNFKSLTKKSPAILKLKPSAKHVDVLKVENHLHELEGYYK
jgi:hypothetical protein